MTLDFGKHRGLPVELLVLRDPAYVCWALAEREPTPRLAVVRREVRRLIAIFDAKPLIVPCTEADCGNTATCASAYRGSTGLRWWCDDCAPHARSATRGNIEIVRSYFDVINHIATSGNGSKDACERLICDLARAKGLPDHVGEAQARIFFAAALPRIITA